MTNHAKAKNRFTDPRARGLLGGAYLALGTATAPGCFLGSYLVGSGGQMNQMTWIFLGVVATLAVGSAIAMALAPRLEAEALRYQAAARAAVAVQLAARSAPPGDPTPAGPAVPFPTPPPLPPLRPVAAPRVALAAREHAEELTVVETTPVPVQ